MGTCFGWPRRETIRNDTGILMILTHEKANEINYFDTPSGARHYRYLSIS